jgi:hypothetical protein
MRVLTKQGAMRVLKKQSTMRVLLRKHRQDVPTLHVRLLQV